ncbi:hypothetical protein LINPERHAP1_LOCUS31578 [Linum perenne]
MKEQRISRTLQLTKNQHRLGRF